MTDDKTTSTMLIKEGAFLPETVRFESEPYSKGWRLVKDLRGSEMEGQLLDAGWNLFCLAEELHASAVGSDLGKTTRRAIEKVLDTMKSDKLNCVEITQVAAKRFLGLPYVTISAHARPIQESKVLFHLNRVGERDRAKLAAVPIAA